MATLFHNCSLLGFVPLEEVHLSQSRNTVKCARRSHAIHYKINDDVCGFLPLLYATLLVTSQVESEPAGLSQEAHLEESRYVPRSRRAPRRNFNPECPHSVLPTERQLKPKPRAYKLVVQRPGAAQFLKIILKMSPRTRIQVCTSVWLEN